ncbi:MAG: hypothetical protein Q7J16_10725 [Candidatus Cloacimonadales bacterium]|nr:hypothetical protein [Candidatus Cloacimonadales bacterium]
MSILSGKKIQAVFRLIISIAIVISIALFTFYIIYNAFVPKVREIEILLVTHHDLNIMEENIKKAYSSVLEEEGVPFKWTTRGELWRYSPKKILSDHQVMIFPDFVSQKIPQEFEVWVEDYVSLGGNVFIVYNSGTQTEDRTYREKAVFSRLLGMNYVTYNKYQSLAFQMAKVRFKDCDAVNFFEIPCGKVDELFTITGYQYGPLDYPLARVDVSFVDDKNVLAYSLYSDGKSSPNTFWKKMGKGNVVYANLPLGYLKAYGTDDLMIRCFLETFLYKIAFVPHLDRLPYHRGGIVLNWHIDDARERKNIYTFEKKGIIRKNLRQSFHITAGDFLFERGDDRGFNASKYPNIVRDIMKYGIIGSHGGWAHNWFVEQLENNRLTDEEFAYYVDINNKTLSMITNYPIREYAAPSGIHPQPFLTKLLEERGFLAYYYPGDLGSEPNRTFYKGVMVSDKVIAFPVMPRQDIVSVQEFANEGVSATEYEKWLLGILDYAAKQDNLCLIYNHIYDFEANPQYVKPFYHFLDKVEYYIKEGKLTVETLSYFAEFILRFLKTDYKFVINYKENFMSVALKNPEGLEGISVAIPKNLFRKPPGSGFYIDEDKYYYYAVITENVYEKNIICHLH